MLNKTAHYYQTFAMLSEEELVKYKTSTAGLEFRMRAYYDDFYEWTRTQQYVKSFFTDEVRMGIKMNEQSLWDGLLNFILDDHHIARQQFYGQTFASIGVSYEAYCAAIIYLHTRLEDIFEEEGILTLELCRIFKKVTNLTLAIISDTYTEATNRMLTEQNQALMEMSTPVTQLWDGILLLPLVGFIDSKRAQETMSAMLEMIGKTQAKVFILDISGVAVVDTAVANYFIKITKASKLMGCTCMISGISGSVAQTIVELGIQIEEVATTGNMKEALNRALGATGAKVVYLEQK